MSEFNFKLTEAMSAILKNWGWMFIGGLGNTPSGGWYKYDKEVLVAMGGSEMWQEDFVVARLATMREGEVLVTPIEELSKPVIDLLKGMGWVFAMTGPNEWTWLKYDETWTVLATAPGRCWDADVEAAERLTAEDEWVCTTELRFMVRRSLIPRLQQKWMRMPGPAPTAGGATEWRDVPSVDHKGYPST